MKSKDKKILVVDDSNAYRQAIKKELEAAGYEVEEAGNGFEALVRLSAPPAPDLITMDVEMPKLDGFEVCRRLSDEHYGRLFENRRPPVIFVTSKDTMESRRKGFELGAADFVTKPFREGEISATVDNVLADKRPGLGLTALVVDDSAGARKIVAECLQREGLEVLEAENGLQAFEIVKELKGDVDLIITDLLMPVMDGAELIRKIRRELMLEEVPVVFLTAVEDRSELLNLFKAGASDYLVKPFPKEELLARINVHLERTQLTRRLTAMVEELKKLNRMKDNLLSVCSHDLRSPLTGILGFTDHLLGKDYLEPDDRDGLESIKASGVALLGFIDDILDLGKARSENVELKMETVSIAEVIHASIGALGHTAARKRQDLNFADRCSKECRVQGNKVGLNRVMNNLISNAIKYTPEGGKIQVSLQIDDDKVRVEVTDNGIGIPEEKLPNLFDPFTQFHQLGASGEFGVGLGMSIVKEILDKHDAEIRVYSSPGKGTRCRILFRKAEADEQSPVSRPNTSSRKKEVENNRVAPADIQGTVLLAEDDELNRKLAGLVLAEVGLKADIVDDGRQALEKFFSAPDKYDLVLLDCRMPGIDGLETARRIREKGFKSVPVLALTAHNKKKELNECILAGMDQILSKPLTPKAVADAFKNLVKSKTATEGEEEFGLKQIAESLNFDEKKCAKYLKLFSGSADKCMEQLSEALENSDPEKAADALHTIKGGSLSLKLDNIRGLAEKLEYRAKDGFLDEVAEKKAALEEELTRVRNLVQS